MELYIAYAKKLSSARACVRQFENHFERSHGHVGMEECVAFMADITPLQQAASEAGAIALARILTEFPFHPVKYLHVLADGTVLRKVTLSPIDRIEAELVALNIPRPIFDVPFPQPQGLL